MFRSRCKSLLVWILHHAATATASKDSGTPTTIIVPVSGVATGNSIIVRVAMDPLTGTLSCTHTRSNSYAVDKDITNGSGTTAVRTVILSPHNVIALTSGN